MSEYGSLQRLEAPRGTDGRRQKAGEGGRPPETAAGRAAWLPSPARRLPPGFHNAGALYCTRIHAARRRVEARCRAVAPVEARGRAWPLLAAQQPRVPLFRARFRIRAPRCVCSHVHCAVTCTVPPAHRGQARSLPPTALLRARLCQPPSWHGGALTFYRRSPYIRSGEGSA